MRVRSWIVVRERLSSCCTLHIVDLRLPSYSMAGVPVDFLKDGAGLYTSIVLHGGYGFEVVAGFGVVVCISSSLCFALVYALCSVSPISALSLECEVRQSDAIL